METVKYHLHVIWTYGSSHPCTLTDLANWEPDWVDFMAYLEEDEWVIPFCSPDLHVPF